MKCLRVTIIVCAVVVLVTLLGSVHSTHAQGFPWPRMAISPDGTLVAVSGPVYDETHSPIHILDANTGQLLMTFRDPELGRNNALDWSPDGTQVLSGDSAGSIDIWNVIDGTHTVLRRGNAPSEGAGWSPAGNAILRMSAGFIQLLDPTTGKELPNSLLPTLTLVRAAAWNADGSRLAAVGREGIKVWDTTTTNWPLITEFVDDHSTWDLAWSTDGSWLATAGQNGVWVYNTATWQVEFVLPLDTEGMDSVTWHPNGTLIAGSTGDTVYVWDVQTRQVITTYPITVAMDVEWHPDGERLFFAGGPQGRPYVNGVVLGSPSADAGQDRSIVDSDGSGEKAVTLDGSASSDLDGTIPTYRWYENDTLIAEGVTPQVELGVDVHVITLTVTDNDNLTSSDEVTVTIVPARGWDVQSQSGQWQIPQIACDMGKCIRQDRVDGEGNLYVYIERFEPVRQEIVYVIERNSSQITEYDLSPIYSRRGILRDFVPFADGKLLIVEYQVPAPVTLVDLQTQQATSLDIDFDPRPCHDFMATIATRIQRVGQDRILFCSSGRDGRTLILTRLQNDTLSVEDTLIMGRPQRIESGVVPLWRTLADGLDGKIYIVPFPDAPILGQVAPEYEGYDWSDYVVLRYDPATQQWDSVFIEASTERWNAEGSFLIYMGIDPAGNLYFANGISSITDFVKYNPQGEKVWHLTEADFGLRRFKPLVVDENQFILDFGDYGQIDLEYAVQNESTHLLLVDESNTALAPLADGLTIDRNQFPTAAAIRVETAPAIVGSVLFDLNGTTMIDNEAPYTLPLPIAGAYTLTATPYAEADGQGEPGIPLSVTFEVIGSGTSRQPTAPADPPTYTVTAGDTAGLINERR